MQCCSNMPRFSISWYNKTKYKVFSDGMYVRLSGAPA